MLFEDGWSVMIGKNLEADERVITITDLLLGTSLHPEQCNYTKTVPVSSKAQLSVSYGIFEATRIIATPNPGESIRAFRFEDGIEDDYVAKPVSPKELLEKITRWIRNK